MTEIAELAYTPTSWVDGVTPVNAANMNKIEAALGATDTALGNYVSTLSAVAGLGIVQENRYAAGDAQPSFRYRADGKFFWGLGGATATDTNLYRSAVGQLKTDGSLLTGSFLVAQSGTNQVAAGEISPFVGGAARPGLVFGSALDTNLYRSGAGTLKTDGALHVGGLSYANVGTANQVVMGYSGGAAPAIAFGATADATIYRSNTGLILTACVFGSNHGGHYSYLGSAYIASNSYMGGYWAGGIYWDGTNWINPTAGGNNGWALLATQGAAGGVSFYTEPATGGVQRSYTPAQLAVLTKFGIDNAGKVWFGTGVGGDTSLYRLAAGVLKTDGALEFSATLQHRPATYAAGELLNSKAANEAQKRFLIQNDGLIAWGPGGAVGADISLSRNTEVGPARLYTPNVFTAQAISCRPGTAGATAIYKMNIDWTGSGQLWIDGTNMGTFSFVSDARYKKSIRPLKSTWEAVKEIVPVSYRWRNKGLFIDDGKDHVGFLAQEVQKPVPAAVYQTMTPDGKADEEQPLSLNIVDLVATLTKALQEAMTRIEVLEGKPA